MDKIPIQIIAAIKKFTDLIRTEIDVKKVLLFGSYAKGRFTEDSDIDVCIIAGEVSNNYLAMLQIISKVIGVDTRIEPVVFSKDEYEDENSMGLLREIKNNNIEII